MKKLVNLILWSIVFSSIGTIGQAQVNSGCFMLDAQGNPLDLGYLCQNSNSSNSKYEPKAANPQETETTKQSGVHIVPIKSRRSGIPVIDVKFDDRYVFEMMLDTGASGVVITKEMADTLKVNHHETVRVSTPSHNNVELSSGYVYSMQVGEINHKNTKVITAPTMDMGLLGQSFFGGYDLTIKSDVIEFRER